MDLEATPAERKQLEYASQHFGFTSDSLLDTITSFAMDNLNDVMEGMREHCVKEFGKKVPEEEIRGSFARIQERYVVSTEKVLDNLSAYVKKNILSVPQHVLLPEDRAHASGEPLEVDMVEELNGFDRLCESSRGTRHKAAVLEAKLENLRKVKERQRAVSSEAEFLEECCGRVGATVDDQVEALEKQMAAVRVLMNKLNEAFGKREVDEDGVDASRKRQLRQDDQEEGALAKRALTAAADAETE